MILLNRTHAEHSVIAVLLQLLLAPLALIWLTPATSLWVTGAIVCSVFLGREIQQHEYKGGGSNAVPPWYGLIHHWTPDSILDFVCPVLACSAVAILAQLLMNYW